MVAEAQVFGDLLPRIAGSLQAPHPTSPVLQEDERPIPPDAGSLQCGLTQMQAATAPRFQIPAPVGTSHPLHPSSSSWELPSFQQDRGWPRPPCFQGWGQELPSEESRESVGAKGHVKSIIFKQKPLPPKGPFKSCLFN